jgi:hypothetical protein
MPQTDQNYLAASPPLPKGAGNGYRRAAKVYKLKFTEDEFTGLEVRAKSVPLGKFLDLTKLVDLQNGTALGPEQMEQIRDLFTGFATALVSWNLQEEDGTDVPATLEGLYSQEFDFVLQIIMAWMEAIAGVAAPLVRSSNSGATIPEGSLPMVPLSPSPESLTTSS